ncbi:MAG: diguanylate cyclase domain-containing protein [Leptolyngbya sp. IPPAS B-1204]|nr:MAG: diguanylate cyclase [Leptolyngbya sp. IPPAS B-1204]
MHLPIRLAALMPDTALNSKPPKSIPLLLILVFPCLLQMLTTVGVIGLLSLQNQQTNDLDHTLITLMLCLLSVSVTLAMVLYLSRKLAGPILRLSEASRRIAQGECQLVDVGRVEELAVLAKSFNQMSQEIQQSRRKLEDYSQSLEQKVRERTEALEQEIQRCTAIEVVLHEANQELERLAFMDGLTQVANRRHFDDRLNQEWWRLKRKQAPLSIILCDIDFFKQYNDTYGHQAGDECLRRVANALIKAAARPADLVARYGGEEFALILPDTPALGAIQVARKIQTVIRQLQIPHQGSAVSPYVTLSVGIASTVPHSSSSLNQLIQSADSALYRAKSRGRNCTVINRLSLGECDLRLA